MFIVAIRVGSMPKIVLDGTTEIIASLEVEEISEALGKLASSSDLRATVGAVAQKFTLANFGVK